MQKKQINSWIYNIVFIALLTVLLFVPEAKALVIRGMMEVGLFNPSLKPGEQTTKSDLSTITFKNAKGDILNLEDLKGKVIFLNFWATWCPPCLAEMPSIEKLYQKYKDDAKVAFVMVEADGNFAKANAFMTKKEYSFPIYTFHSNLPKQIFDRSLPTTVVFDKQGRLSMHHVGASNYNSKKFIDFIEQLKSLKD